MQSLRSWRTAKVWFAAGASLLALGVVAALAPTIRAQAGVQGQWRTLASPMPINPVHLALMNNGTVLIVSGSGNVPTVTQYQAAVWDPQLESLVTQSLAWDMFCNGMVVLPDGRPFINGGTLQYDPFFGQPRSAVFDLATGLFTDVQNMAHGRWYPTTTTLGDGRVMTFSGLTETGGTNTTVEIYTVGAGWSAEAPAGWTPPLYPRMHLLPDGTVLYSGSGTGSRVFNPSTRTWSGVVATTNYAGTRTYGTSVLLPLTPANGYKPRVMIMGGGNPATPTTEIIDMSAATPKWVTGPPMSQPRIEMNATILPNGKVLAVGGSTNDEDVTTASLNADLYDPATNTFSSAGANVYPRVYHSGSLLLPDATVLLIGGNPVRGTYENAHGDLLAGVSVQRERQPRRAAGDHRGDAECLQLRRRVPGADHGRGQHHVGRAGPARRAHARVRHGSAAGRARLHDGHRGAERDGAAQREHRTARLLHALRAERGGRAVGRELRARLDHDSARRHDHDACEWRDRLGQCRQRVGHCDR